MIKWFMAYLAAVVLLVTATGAYVLDAVNDVKLDSSAQYHCLNSRINTVWDIVWDAGTPADYRRLQSASVKVIVPQGSGSGVLVTRQVGKVNRTFVWTAGHVVENLGSTQPTIYRELRVGGLLKVTTTAKAKVIAYSAPDEEDLALLEIEAGWQSPLSVATVFDSGVQPVGTEVVHVGSTVGIYNSVSLGIVSQTDRILTGVHFDQTSVMGYPGSSGGGVFLKNGACIGLLTRGYGPGLNFIVPVRRMRAWAEKAGVVWALDYSVPVPLSRAPTDLETNR